MVHRSDDDALRAKLDAVDEEAAALRERAARAEEELRVAQARIALLERELARLTTAERARERRATAHAASAGRLAEAVRLAGEGRGREAFHLVRGVLARDPASEEARALVERRVECSACAARGAPRPANELVAIALSGGTRCGACRGLLELRRADP